MLAGTVDESILAPHMDRVMACFDTINLASSVSGDELFEGLQLLKVHSPSLSLASSLSLPPLSSSFILSAFNCLPSTVCPQELTTTGAATRRSSVLFALRRCA